jgi:GT2 family glycosyltransferase
MINAAELDVVIVNYNSGQMLEQCLSHLYSMPGIGINVSIIDNNSTDDSLLCLKSKDQTISVIKNSANIGFSSACNQGVESGQAAQIAFVNPDCFINSQQLEQLSNQLAQHDGAALIGCRVLNDDGSLQAASRRRLPTFWRIIWHLTGFYRWPMFKGINIDDDGKFEVVQKVEAVNGACYLVKRTVFEQLNGFDEAYPLHFEDLDLFARIQAEHFNIIYDSSVEVKHLKGQSKQDSQQIKAWKKQGLLRYLAKHRPQWEYRAVKFWLD